MLRYLLKRVIEFYSAAHQIFPHRRTCVFYPTCSEYALAALDKHGTWRGGKMMILRIFRCHPWQKNNYDPVK